MSKHLLYTASFFGATAVILGAFGAHILKDLLTPNELNTYQTGVQYQFYHTFAILGTAIIRRYTSRKWTNAAGWLFSIGIVFFSGSLYLLAMSNSLNLNSIKFILGPMTPIGGMLFIAGWVTIYMAATKYKEKSGRK